MTLIGTKNPTEVDALTAEQLLAVQALLRGESIPKVAESAQVAERTINRWLKLDHFREALQEGKRQSYSRSITLLVDAASVAVSTLVEVSRNPQETATSRVMAARAILEYTVKGWSHSELMERIAKLEEVANV